MRNRDLRSDDSGVSLGPNHKSTRKRGIKVTVCIAAICSDESGSTIFGAADRTISTQDMEFEPPTRKIFPLTTSITVMTAGDTGLHTEIIGELRREIRNRIEKTPTEWILVKDVTDLYVKFYNEIKLKRAEATLLAPLGLDHNSFIEKQGLMAPDFIKSLTRDMIQYPMPDVSILITGLDPQGAHIFVVDDGSPHCLDKVGFAAVGIGARHAESQFMLAGHSGLSQIPETLLLVFTAKRRAEVAPGVGRATDMILIGPGLGVTVPIDDGIVTDLGKMYERNADKEKEARKDAQAEVIQYLAEINEAAIQKAQKSEDKLETDGGQPSTNESPV